MTIDISSFRETFFEESFEGLQIMESSLLELDPSAPDPEEVNAIFRAAHSIKGGSGTFGLHAVGALTHLLETLLDDVRQGGSLDADTVELLLAAVDCLAHMLQCERESLGVDDARVEETQRRIARCLASRQGIAPDEPASTERPAVASGPTAGGWRVRFQPHPDLFRSGNDPVLILRELATLGPTRVQARVDALPPLGSLDPERSYLGWDIDLLAEVEEGAIREVFAWVEDECALELSPLPAGGAGGRDAAPSVWGAAPRDADSASPAGPDEPEDRRRAVRRGGEERRKGGERPAESSSIRVSTDKVDGLVNIVGELVITHAMLTQLIENFTPSSLEALREGLGQLDRNTREIQDAVMRIRMLPIRFVLARLPRLVHDLSSQLGRRAELEITGGETEVDKTVLERLGDPLVHLVRNCLDHGIEPPEQRAASGKPEVGRVWIHAYHQGGTIVVEIGDDGRGIDRERLVDKAVAAGLVAAEDAPADDRALDLIFHPGLSTAATISDISGRGVGMDVVRRNVRDLGGQIEVQSTPRRGTRFIIRLPLTLAILDGQLVRVGTETYVLPLVSMIESTQLDEQACCHVPGRRALYRFRDRHVPIVQVAEVFGTHADEQAGARRMLAVVESAGQQVGLVIDELMGQHQVVIKSLETNFRRVPGVAGATILGDGTVALILDVAGILELTS